MIGSRVIAGTSWKNFPVPPPWIALPKSKNFLCLPPWQNENALAVLPKFEDLSPSKERRSPDILQSWGPNCARSQIGLRKRLAYGLTAGEGISRTFHDVQLSNKNRTPKIGLFCPCLLRGRALDRVKTSLLYWRPFSAVWRRFGCPVPPLFAAGLNLYFPPLCEH